MPLTTQSFEVAAQNQDEIECTFDTENNIYFRSEMINYFISDKKGILKNSFQKQDYLQSNNNVSSSELASLALSSMDFRIITNPNCVSKDDFKINSNADNNFTYVDNITTTNEATTNLNNPQTTIKRNFNYHPKRDPSLANIYLPINRKKLSFGRNVGIEDGSRKDGTISNDHNELKTDNDALEEAGNSGTKFECDLCL